MRPPLTRGLPLSWRRGRRQYTELIVLTWKQVFICHTAIYPKPRVSGKYARWPFLEVNFLVPRKTESQLRRLCLPRTPVNKGLLPRTRNSDISLAERGTSPPIWDVLSRNLTRRLRVAEIQERERIEQELRVAR